MRGTLLALLMVFSLLAGCASTPPAAVSTTPSKQLDAGVNKLDIPVLSSDEPGNRSLAAAPQWRLGEYWEYSITDEFSGETTTASRIVAGTDGSNYLVGFPIEAFKPEVLVLHMPGYGDIAQSNLGYETHDVQFTPLSFPLRAGDTWKTSFEGQPGNAIVESVSGDTAVLSWQGPGFNMTATYDAQAGEVVKLQYPGYMHYEVTKHGYHYTGLVRVPHAHDLIFQNGRIGPVTDPRDPLVPPQPRSTQDKVEVQPGYDHLAFVLMAANVVPFVAGPLSSQQTPAAGYYEEKATAPNGTAYDVVMLPQETGTKSIFVGSGDPTGTWTLDHTVGGPGLVLAEGIGYHSIDVTLPSGCVVVSANAGHHNGPCKVSASAAGDTQASQV